MRRAAREHRNHNNGSREGNIVKQHGVEPGHHNNLPAAASAKQGRLTDVYNR